MNYIFFDVDGVLNGTDKDGKFIDSEIHEDKVDILIEIAKRSNSKLVMSSSWRVAWNSDGTLKKERDRNVKLHQMLKDAGYPLYSVTPVIEHNRDVEIKEWLKQNSTKDDKFVCLDDEKSYYQKDKLLKNRFVHTAPDHCDGYYGDGDVVGLFESHIAKALKILQA